MSRDDEPRLSASRRRKAGLARQLRVLSAERAREIRRLSAVRRSWPAPRWDRAAIAELLVDSPTWRAAPPDEIKWLG